MTTPKPDGAGPTEELNRIFNLPELKTAIIKDRKKKAKSVMRKLIKEITGSLPAIGPSDFWHPKYGLWSEMSEIDREKVRKEYLGG